MDLAANKIPNKMLRGDEVLECAVAEFREMLKRDQVYFTRGIAFKRVAFSLSATFHFGYPLPQDHVLKSRTKTDGVLEGEAPLSDLPEHESVVLGLERDVDLDNPNVARIGHDLPIIVQERRPPESVPTTGGIPGETPSAVTNPFPQIVNHELKYDKTQAPKGPAPVDRDVSESVAAKMGVKTRTKS